MDKSKKTIMKQLPPSAREMFRDISFEGLEEIRFRRGQPIQLYYQNQCFYLSRDGGICQRKETCSLIEGEEIERVLSSFLEDSVYAHMQDICNGFITLQGGHRVGLAGRCVLKDGKICNISEISGLNVRVAQSYTGCAEALAERMLTPGGLHNNLIIAPPQCGKTTFLRDLVRIFSKRMKVTVVDERSEIAAMHEGIPQFDVGPQTDVLDRFPKTVGMMLAVRSLSPQLIVVDEIGTEADVEAVKQVQHAGCRLLASVHGEGQESIRKRNPRLLDCFEQSVTLGRQNGVPAVVAIEKTG
ncbi:MAG: stage III sporulation protein AA [Ruminococcaceae bacterium]|nr:stage III sporulation protein AA [Oscillospiraceae bacterium]